MLLIYYPPCCLTVSIPELSGEVLGVVLRNPKWVVLGDFSVHVEAALTEAVQDFMTSMTSRGLYPVITVCIYYDRVFCFGAGRIWSEGGGTDNGSFIMNRSLFAWVGLNRIPRFCRSGGSIEMIYLQSLLWPAASFPTYLPESSQHLKGLFFLSVQPLLSPDLCWNCSLGRSGLPATLATVPPTIQILVTAGQLAACAPLEE